MRRTATIAGLVLAVTALAPANAEGDGLPVQGMDAGGAGDTVPRSPAGS